MKSIIIDVREPSEYASGHAEGAINIPPQELLAGSAILTNTAKDTELILYCRTGSRSAVAKNILTRQGFTNIVNGINKEQVKARFDNLGSLHDNTRGD